MTDKEGRMGRTRSLDEELIVDEKKARLKIFVYIFLKLVIFLFTDF